MIRRRAEALVLLLVGTAAAADHAQLAGRVDDSSGAALVDAMVSAVNEDTGIRRSARSDAAGQYAIGALEPGNYKVTARIRGFQTVTRLDVKLAAGRETRVDFLLPLGSMREEVTVRESAPEDASRDANPDDGTIAFTAGRRTIDSLPLDGRGILTLVELAPGVVTTPASSGEAGQFSANGMRPNANYFSVDGVSANTGVTGSATPAQFPGAALPSMTAFGGLQSLAALDALQEVRIETSSFAPDSGRMPGAQVRMTTRSGSNDWHGSFAYAFRNERLAANDWLSASRGSGRSPLRLNQWAGTLGGPIRRDRTFFFAAWEGLRLRAPFAWLGATPSAEARQSAPAPLAPILAAFPPPAGRSLGPGLAEYMARGSSASRLDSGSLRIDQALGSHAVLFGRYSEAPSTSESGFLHVERASFETRNATIGANTSFGPAITMESRLRVASDSANARWLDNAVDMGTLFHLLGVQPVGGSLPATTGAIYGVSIAGVGQVLSGATDGNRQGQMHIVNSLGWTRGAHNSRIGLEYERLTPSRQQPALAVAGMWPDLASLLEGAPARVAIVQAAQASSLIERMSAYAQDTWRPTARLTMTYGVRWEITPAPSIRESQGAPATASAIAPAPRDGASGTVPPANPSNPVAPPTALQAQGVPLWPTRYGQIAPRFGAAYRLDDRTVLRAGWGIFYDVGFSAVTDPINGFPFNRWQFGDVAGAVSTATSALGSGFLPNLKLPYSREWNVSLQRALSASDVLSVSYVASAGRQLLRREAGAQVNGLATGSVVTNDGRSDFHAMEVGYRRRLARGVDAVAHYRWGHAIDNGSWDSWVALAAPNYGPGADRGSSAFDVRHEATGAVTFESRGLGRSGVLHRLTADWKMQAIGRARSGFPIDILDSENQLGFGWDDATRPDVVAEAPIWIADPSLPGGRRLNPEAFRRPAVGQGSLGRNAVAGLGMFQADAAIRRRFPLADSASLEIGATCFNLANHPNAADPVRFLNSPYFGQPVSMLNLMLGSGTPRSGLTPAFQLGSARSLELGLKLRF